MTPTVTETLARFSAGLTFDDLPGEVVRETKRIILDTLGCAFGAVDLDKGRMSIELVREMGGRPEATIVGTREKVPAASAAFANAELMNALDWCALQPPAHVAPYVISSALALAEVKGRSGKDVIVAVALAQELACRIGISLGGLRATEGGFPVRSWGIGCNQFGATAGAARILGLDEDRMIHALGLAGYFAPVASHVKYNHTVHVGLAKYAPSGWIAQGGVVTALLAEKGYRGDETVMDGEYGFWAMNGSQSFDRDKAAGRLGEHWASLVVGYKFWPCCGMFQSDLDAFSALIDEHGLEPGEIEEVVVNSEAFSGLPKYVSTDIRDHVEAASSMPYNIAVAAHRVPLGPKWQAQVTMDDPAIRAFMPKVKHGIYPRCEETRHQDLVVEGRPYLNHRPALVEVRARGTTYAKAVDFARWLSMGEESCRATDDGLAGKFRANAADVLRPDRTEMLIDAILNLEGADDVRPLAQAMAG